MRSCLFRHYMAVESDGFLMFPHVTDMARKGEPAALIYVFLLSA